MTMKVCIGGTFLHFHKGHYLLIDTALTTAGERGYLFIGVMENEQGKAYRGKSFIERKQQIEGYLSKRQTKVNVDIQPIADRFGPTLQEDFDCIVISPETRSVAEEINTKRQEQGLSVLNIIQIPFVYADDGQRISSTRIEQGEIDEQGHLVR